jgi:hypothetical protein
VNKEDAKNLPKRIRNPTTWVLFAVLLGALLRFLGVCSELWLDEVWSLANVNSLNSATEIFTELKTDNNHLLTSLWMYFLPVGWEFVAPAVRLPSVFWIAFSVPLTFLLAKQRSDSEGPILSLLLSGSFVLILYSSEARGYSGLITCILGCMWLAAYTCKSPGVLSGVALNVVCILGALSHFSFFKFYVALSIWHFWQFCMYRGVRKAAVFTGALFMPSLIAFTALYVGYISTLPSGTGPLRNHFEVVCNTLSVMVGGPQMLPSAPLLSLSVLVLALVVCAFAVIAALEVKRKRETSWALYSAALFLVPILVLLIMKPRVLFVRYFLVEIIVFLFLFAQWLGSRFSEGWKSKAVASTLLLCYLIGNGLYIARFLQFGRGEYREIVTQVIAGESPRVEFFASDEPPFRHQMMLEHYTREHGFEVSFSHVQPDDGKPAPRWRLTHDVDGRNQVGEEQQFKGKTYLLKKSGKHAALSGFSWYLFERSSDL